MGGSKMMAQYLSVSIFLVLTCASVVNASQHSQEAQKAVLYNQVIDLYTENVTLKALVNIQKKRITELSSKIYEVSPLQESLEAKVENLSKEICNLIDELEKKRPQNRSP